MLKPRKSFFQGTIPPCYFVEELSFYFLSIDIEHSMEVLSFLFMICIYIKESLVPRFACLTSSWYGIVLCYLFLGSWTWRHAYKGDNFLLPFSNPNSPMDKCWRPIFCHYSGPYSSFKGWALQGYNRVMDELGLVPLRRINLFLRTSLCTNSNPKIQKGKIHICIWMN